MKIRLAVFGVALTGLLMLMNHISFGQSEEDIPPVPIKGDADVTAEVSPEDLLGEPAAIPAPETTAPAVAEPMPSTDTTASTEGSEQIELTAGVALEGVEVSDDSGEDLITISLDNAPLGDVVRMFSRISGANIVAGTNLQGAVTVSMHDVPWEPALRAILDSSGLALAEKTQGIYSIVTKSELAAEPVTVETLFLEFTAVSNIYPVVKQMLVHTNSSVSIFPSANALVVQESTARLSEIRETVRKIDKPRPQVYIEAKFIELNDQAIEDLGVNWQVLQGYTVRAGNLGFGYNEEDISTRSRSDTVTRNYERIDETELNDVRYSSSGDFVVDGAGNTIGLSGRNGIPNITTEVNPGIPGVNPGDPAIIPPFFETKATLSDVLPARRGRNTTTISEAADWLSEATDAETVTKLLSATLSADELAVTLSALKQTDGVEVVSNPKIIVANGETASIHVGRNEPNVTAVPTGDTGDRFAVALDSVNPYIEIGVKLEVTPTVNTEQNIEVKIVPELSRKLGDLEVGIVGVSYPITQVRRIETRFQLESGRTVAIGGLTETSDQEFIKKVPLLGDIPVIGKYLFTHRHTEKLQDEVVIFVTVGMANPKNLVEVSGIPSGGQLIHRHLANKAAAKADVDVD